MEKRWKIKGKVEGKSIAELAKTLSINSRLAEVLVKREINSFDLAKSFFRPSLLELHDPFLMKGMAKAVARILAAIQSKEKILFFGDYDVDGTTAVALMISYFSEVYPNVDYYIPDRYQEGYGVSIEGVDYAKEIGASLIVSLDCGIKANDKVDYANKNGIDFIICDHHRPGDSLPKATAILDPKQDDCTYPYDELSGCGIGYKLIQAIHSTLENRKDFRIEELLDLVAISTSCDIVPLTGENRVLCYYGLQKINDSPRPGVKALFNSEKNKELTVTDLVFTIGPKINAAGRIEHGKRAVELLIDKDSGSVSTLGKRIIDHNTERKELDKQTTEEALSLIFEDEWYHHSKSTVVYNEEWHKGVIGIVASRLIETHYKPTVVLTQSNGKVAGSARSVKGFDVYKAIEQCEGVIEQFGGHKYAAGLTMAVEQVSAFRTKFEEAVSSTILPEQMLPEIEIDAELTFDDIDSKFFRIMQQMAPFGPKNMKPIFVTRNVYDKGYSRIVGATGEHVKLNVYQKEGSEAVLNGIGFGLAEHIDLITSGNPFDIVYQLDLNEWQGITSIQLIVKDIRATDEQDRTYL